MVGRWVPQPGLDGGLLWPGLNEGGTLAMSGWGGYPIQVWMVGAPGVPLPPGLDDGGYQVWMVEGVPHPGYPPP